VPARSALLTARAEYSARRPICLERVHIASASRAANDAHERGGLKNMKQPVSIRDKLASKCKRVFKRLATCERRALSALRLLRRNFIAAMYFGEILPSFGFPWHGTDFGYRVLWGKISSPRATSI
jgi:hypothetical protein